MSVWLASTWNIGQTWRNTRKWSKSWCTDTWEEASAPLCGRPSPTTPVPLEALIKQNSLLSMEALEGEPPPKYTTNYVQHRTDAHVLFSSPQDSCILYIFFLRILICSVLCMYINPTIIYMCSVTLAFVAENQKRMEMSFVIHKCGLHCLPEIQTD